MAVLLMIWFSFTAAAICYREHLHIGVVVLPNALTGWQRIALGWLVELLMAGTNLFMPGLGRPAGAGDLVPGHRRVSRSSRSGVSYLPVPIGGAVILLFVIERLWTGTLFGTPIDDALSRVALE